MRSTAARRAELAPTCDGGGSPRRRAELSPSPVPSLLQRRPSSRRPSLPRRLSSICAALCSHLFFSESVASPRGRSEPDLAATPRRPGPGQHGHGRAPRGRRRGVRLHRLHHHLPPPLQRQAVAAEAMAARASEPRACRGRGHGGPHAGAHGLHLRRARVPPLMLALVAAGRASRGRRRTPWWRARASSASQWHARW